MIRLSGLFFLVLAVALGAVLFWTSQSVQRLDVSLYQANQNVNDEKENIRLLSAEWEYLNRPERLEMLAEKYSRSRPHSGYVTGGVLISNSLPENIVPPTPAPKPARKFLRSDDQAADQVEGLINRTLAEGL